MQAFEKYEGSKGHIPKLLLTQTIASEKEKNQKLMNINTFDARNAESYSLSMGKPAGPELYVSLDNNIENKGGKEPLQREADFPGVVAEGKGNRSSVDSPTKKYNPMDLSAKNRIEKGSVEDI